MQPFTPVDAWVGYGQLAAGCARDMSESVVKAERHRLKVVNWLINVILIKEMFKTFK